MTDCERGSGSVTVELWVTDRRVPAGSVREAVRERLEELADVGAILGYDVRTWGRAVALDDPAAGPDSDPPAHGTAPDREVRERVRTFADGLLRQGDDHAVLPDVEHRASGRGGPARPVQRLPDLVVAAYEDGDLLWVGRCGDPACEPTVFERLDAIAPDGTDDRELTEAVPQRVAAD